MKLTDYLGAKSFQLLDLPPFNTNTVERTVEEDLRSPLIDYVCEGCGISFTCDGDENIQTIFIEAEGLHLLEKDLPVHSGRQQVIARLGMPSLSGEPRRHDILGAYGAWDRYDFEGHSVHFTYEQLENRIHQITLMLSAIAPQGLRPPIQ